MSWTAANGQEITDEMIDRWRKSYEQRMVGMRFALLCRTSLAEQFDITGVQLGKQIAVGD